MQHGMSKDRQPSWENDSTTKVHWKFTAFYRVPRTAKVPRFRGTRGTRGIFAVLAVLSRYFFFHFAVSEVGSRYFKDGFP